MPPEFAADARLAVAAEGQLCRAVHEGVHPDGAGPHAASDGQADFSIALLQNVAGGARGSAADFAAVRSGAKAGYRMVRFAAAFTNVVAADWQTRVLLNGQWTRDALVPGEQFGAGGATTVRGFG